MPRPAAAALALCAAALCVSAEYTADKPGDVVGVGALRAVSSSPPLFFLGGSAAMSSRGDALAAAHAHRATLAGRHHHVQLA
jgi:hypothetical protein